MVRADHERPAPLLATVGSESRQELLGNPPMPEWRSGAEVEDQLVRTGVVPEHGDRLIAEPTEEQSGEGHLWGPHGNLSGDLLGSGHGLAVGEGPKLGHHPLFESADVDVVHRESGGTGPRTQLAHEGQMRDRLDRRAARISQCFIEALDPITVVDPDRRRVIRPSTRVIEGCSDLVGGIERQDESRPQGLAKAAEPAVGPLRDDVVDRGHRGREPAPQLDSDVVVLGMDEGRSIFGLRRAHRVILAQRNVEVRTLRGHLGSCRARV